MTLPESSDNPAPDARAEHPGKPVWDSLGRTATRIGWGYGAALLWFVVMALITLRFIAPLEEPMMRDRIIEEIPEVAVADPNSQLIIPNPSAPEELIVVPIPGGGFYGQVQIRVDADYQSTVEIQVPTLPDEISSYTIPSEKAQHFFIGDHVWIQGNEPELKIIAGANNTVRRVEVIFEFREKEAPGTLGILLGLGMALLPFLVVCGDRVMRCKKGDRLQRYVLCCTVLIAIGMVLRVQEFDEMRYRPLGYDATGYVEIALKGGPLYETAMSLPPWVREPVWPWILRAWFLVFPGTDSAAMLCAISISVLSLILCAVVGWRVVGFIPGIAAVAMLALTPEWVQMSCRVLRHDLVLFLILTGLLLKSWKSLAVSPMVRAEFFSLWAALMMLTQFGFLLFVFPILIWEAVRKRWKLPEMALAVISLVVIIAPHLMFNAKFQNSGDPLFSSSIHTLYYYNKENLGKPGFPTAAEFRQNPYVGERMSTGKFFFHERSVVQVSLIHLRGYWNMLVWIQPRILVFQGIEWLMLPGAVGGILLLLRRKEWLFFFWSFAVLPFAFISGLGADTRLGLEATVFVVWVWGLGVESLWNGVRSFFPRGTEEG
ncbi:MAG: glycosyltransferase family 39 protein [Candidatus Sumerlaeia bacterium]|nr:glycosyltransferase family 39 protein [Candidatus Sumerlaeia bacterium]